MKLAALLTLLILVAAWSGAGARRRRQRFVAWVRSWDEVEVEPWR